MAVQFPDPNPTATSNIKHNHQKIVRLTFADFIVGTASSTKAVLPADATITSMTFWKKTAFSGNGVSAVLLSIGNPNVQFVSNFDVNTPAAGTQGSITPIINIMQPYNIPNGPDIPLVFAGGAATGNPTAGEIYISINYVR